MTPSLGLSLRFDRRRGSFVGTWLLCNMLVLGLMRAAHSEPGDDPDILRECISVTRDDTLGSNFGDLKSDGMCPLRTEHGFCGAAGYACESRMSASARF